MYDLPFNLSRAYDTVRSYLVPASTCLCHLSTKPPIPVRLFADNTQSGKHVNIVYVYFKYYFSPKMCCVSPFSYIILLPSFSPPSCGHFTSCRRRSSFTPGLLLYMLHPVGLGPLLLFFVLLPTHHVASDAHVKYSRACVLMNNERKRKNTLRKVASPPSPPPGHLHQDTSP